MSDKPEPDPIGRGHVLMIEGLVAKVVELHGIASRPGIRPTVGTIQSVSNMLVDVSTALDELGEQVRSGGVPDKWPPT